MSSAPQGAQRLGTTTDFNIDLSSFDLSDFMHGSGSGSSIGMDDIFGLGGNGNGNRGSGNGGGPSQMMSQYGAGGGGQQQLDGHDDMNMNSHPNSSSDAMQQSQQRQQLLQLSAMHAASQNLATGGAAPIQPSQAIVTTESLRQQLQQQLKLQQLQQLQNHILQQQVSSDNRLVTTPTLNARCSSSIALWIRSNSSQARTNLSLNLKRKS